MIYLENDFIKVGFSDRGAELQSLDSKTSKINYLWNGNSEFWGKHSPVLFPIVGGLKENTYFYEGIEYNLSRHGFARDHKFEYEIVSGKEILFTLKSSAETIKSYPFDFELRLRYVLEGQKISCSYEVKNPSSEKNLLFSIGGHPAFSTPIDNQTEYSDYYLDFDGDTELIYHKLEGDLISARTEVIKLENGKLNLSRALFENDALVFKTLKSKRISIKNDKNEAYQLDFSFNGFPYFGIWAAKGADFVCLEPWCGIADVVEHNRELVSKEGIMTLPANQDWKRTWAVELN
ncbi:MAG: aldose 1-epimerase family protein [Pedobacter sp.]|nr:MAG: aldose 1-epimerase family protein [Pedobacter sp.]